jgi:hypothetical protein
LLRLHGRAGIELRRRARVTDNRPGRTCPLSYRYSPRELDRDPDFQADVLYVAGGLYGNVMALEALQALAAREEGATVVFNGDFHWFDIVPADFESVTREVLGHRALRGNVETEIAGEDGGAGCGCAYPLDVSDAEVARSNLILERLRATARLFPELRERLGALPMHLVARVGEARIGIVHGDAASLAGWGFAHDRLDDPAHSRWVESMFREARVDVFASTHTCLPALRQFDVGVVANNGATGMPNFAGHRAGLVTRIALERFGGPERLYGLESCGVHVECIELAYDHERWIARFLSAWPEGSAAHDSYFRRIMQGPRFELARALRRAA